MSASVPVPDDLVKTSEAISVAERSARTLAIYAQLGQLTLYRRLGDPNNYYSRAELEALTLRVPSAPRRRNNSRAVR